MVRLRVGVNDNISEIVWQETLEKYVQKFENLMNKLHNREENSQLIFSIKLETL